MGQKKYATATPHPGKVRRMKIILPTMDEVKAELGKLTIRQTDRLAELSGVPASTIHKIRYGATENPGVETLRKFLPHIPAALKDRTPAPSHAAAPAAEEAATVPATDDTSAR
jgi:predicted transcriptional regulator